MAVNLDPGFLLPAIKNEEIPVDERPFYHGLDLRDRLDGAEAETPGSPAPFLSCPTLPFTMLAS